MCSKFISLFVFLAFAFSASATPPKYVFFFIGDGMGMGHILSTETYNRTVLGNKNHILMMQFPVSSFALTYSYQNPITDSAAAGTALSTGSKTRNGMLGQNPDTVNVVSIARQLKDKGYGVAIATSVQPDDATPAAFYAHQPSRKMFYEIGKDMAASNYDFFAGSKLRGTTDKNGKPTDLIKVLEGNGYTIAYGRNQLAKAKDKKKILLLDPNTSNDHIGFTIDSINGALTLPEITRAALTHLERVSPNNFFMMLEGGNIDWAAHSNDGGTVVKEVLNFNQALQEAYNFYLKHPKETLIIVTADHDTGGMTVGVSNGPKVVALKNIDYQRVSKAVFMDYCSAKLKEEKAYTWAEMKQYIIDKLGLYTIIPVSKSQNEDLEEEFNKIFVLREKHDTKTLYNTFNSFTEDVFSIVEHGTGFGWTSNNHTGNPVPVFAIGNGAEAFMNVNNNIDIPKKIRKIMEIK